MTSYINYDHSFDFQVQHADEGGDPLVDCPDCSQKFPCSEMEEHYKSCVLTGLKCPWCVRKFSGMGSTFNDHRKREHCWGIFRCPECQHKSHFAKGPFTHDDLPKISRHWSTPLACKFTQPKPPLHSFLTK